MSLRKITRDNKLHRTISKTVRLSSPIRFRVSFIPRVLPPSLAGPLRAELIVNRVSRTTRFFRN